MSKQFPQPPPEVFRAAKRGDRDAMTAIVENYRYLVVAVAKEYVRPAVDIKDLVQEGMLTLFRCVEKFNRQRGRFSTLLVKALCRDLYAHVAQDGTIRCPKPTTYARLSEPSRRKADKARVVGPLNGRDLVAPMPTGSEISAAEVIARLPPGRTRTVMRWRFIDGEKLKQIADRCGISERCAGQLVQRGLTELQRAFGVAPYKPRPRRKPPPVVHAPKTVVEAFVRRVESGESVRSSSRAVGISRAMGDRLIRQLGIVRRCHSCKLPLVRNQVKWCSQCKTRRR